MHGGKCAPLDKVHCLPKFRLRLPRKAHDHIRSDGRVLEVVPQQGHALIKPLCVIFPVHPLQGGVTAALHGQVEVGTQVVQPGRPGTELSGDSPGLQRAQPDPAAGDRLTHPFDQVDESSAVLSLLSP